MGGRGTYAIGNNVDYNYQTIGKYNGVKILEGTGNRHGLPEESHSSNMYLKLHPDGNLNMLRIYDKNHYLTIEIAFHPEPKLTGHYNNVLHVHFYDKNFKRTNASYLPKELFNKYKKYLKGMK